MSERPQVQFENADGVLTVTFEDGKKSEFCTPIRSLAIEAESLAVTHSYEWNAKEIRLGEDVAVVHAKGRLEKDDKLCVIGKPGTKSSNISLSIRSADFSSYLDLEDPPINANLSFIDSDWEIGNESEWWADIYIPKDLFGRLTALIQERRLASLSIRLRSEEFLVQTFDFHTPPSGRVTWYVKDDKYGAEMIHCSTATFYIKERGLNICDVPSEVKIFESEKSSETSDVDMGASSRGLPFLSLGQFQTLSKSLGAIFWGLIAVAAAILYQK